MSSNPSDRPESFDPENQGEKIKIIKMDQA